MTIKYYDFGSEVIHTSERERFAAPGIVECENGKYVRREDYEEAIKRLAEMENIARWCQRRLNVSYRGYADIMIDKVMK